MVMDRSSDYYRPGGSNYNTTHSIANSRNEIYHFRGSRNDYPAKDEHQNHRKHARNRPGHRISDRPLLRSKQHEKERRIFRNPNAPDRFRNLQELTDSEEDEMLLSDNSEGDRPAKRSKVDRESNVKEVAQPRWSNPNPYTALPPPDESTGKRTDVVKLIRKARNATTAKDTEENITNGVDFISFEADSEDEQYRPPPNAPTGPRADADSVLGKRKREKDTYISTARPSIKFEDEEILHEWQPINDTNSTPWLRKHVEELPGIALHKEILDFYEWIRPKDYEKDVRLDLFNRLTVVLNKVEPGDLNAFGSYASGLYLPAGDMDLVFMQRSFKHGRKMRGGLPRPPHIGVLRRFADYIRQQKIALPGTVQIIPSAKVPIIKFVESISGIRVDLSFNNDTGVIANGTLNEWKLSYPDMPVLVSLIKQFLLIRGLNDVSVGGLGGFSIICLVTSLIQHLPGSGKSHNLGDLLLEFFNIYGNLFDREAVAIRLDPPGYIDKPSYIPHLFNKEKAERLTIIDPNRPENNISGGTREIGRIFDCFSTAYEVLQDALDRYSNQSADGAPISFLKDLVGGNFSKYDKQRHHIRDIYYGLKGSTAPIDDLIQPDSALDQHEFAVTTTTATSIQVNGHDQNPADEDGDIKAVEMNVQKIPDKTGSDRLPKKAERRAQRLKAARPDLASKISQSISIDSALQLGGYKSVDTMERDLQKRLVVLARTSSEAMDSRLEKKG